MSVSITDKTVNPLLVTDGKTLSPFGAVKVADTSPLSSTETVTITLSQNLSQPSGLNYSFYPTATDLGTITDPSGGGSFNATTHTFTESGVVAGDPTFATNLLSRLVYHAPTLPNGHGQAEQAAITVKDGASTTTDATPVIIGEITPPAITGTVANEPIASGDKIRPFAAVSISNPYYDYNYYTITPSVPYDIYTNIRSGNYNPKDTATITVTDGGKATDADGLLTGAGLSKTGVGTYAISLANSYNIGYELAQLSFQTVTVPAGQTSNPSFELDVTDGTSNLTTKDTTTSLQVIGPALVPVAPSIAGAQAGQTVAPGNAISPFASVTVSDTNPSPSDSATITLSNPAAGNFTAASYLTAGTAGSFTIAATDPATLTHELDKLSYVPTALASGQTSVTNGFTLAVTNATQNMTATDATTAVTEVAPATPPPPPPNGTTPNNNFLVHDQTTGNVYQSPGETYSGPVAGLTNDIILLTSDNLNVNAKVPNVFIKTGSGEDAIDVSAVNGNNILDGYTGSNFLVGGTGTDTFYTDLRDAASPTWDTISHLHAGDAITVWGVTKGDFAINMADGQGASGYTGLTLDLTKTGQPDAKVTLAGYSQADVGSKVGISYGTSPDTPGLPGSAYMQINITS